MKFIADSKSIGVPDSSFKWWLNDIFTIVQASDSPVPVENPTFQHL
ncbi:hypothetical protein ALQ67_03279 [Pseudomonas savastanoi pv. glycinea]|nr:hypothetical protein ALQ67_03279 [Pseudomonas savastanoi pv. glycinea]